MSPVEQIIVASIARDVGVHPKKFVLERHPPSYALAVTIHFPSPITKMWAEVSLTSTEWERMTQAAARGEF
jgi:hypothetical protein